MAIDKTRSNAEITKKQKDITELLFANMRAAEENWKQLKALEESRAELNKDDDYELKMELTRRLLADTVEELNGGFYHKSKDIRGIQVPVDESYWLWFCNDLENAMSVEQYSDYLQVISTEIHRQPERVETFGQVHSPGGYTFTALGRAVRAPWRIRAAAIIELNKSENGEK